EKAPPQQTEREEAARSDAPRKPAARYLEYRIPRRESTEATSQLHVADLIFSAQRDRGDQQIRAVEKCDSAQQKKPDYENETHLDWASPGHLVCFHGVHRRHPRRTPSGSKGQDYCFTGALLDVSDAIDLNKRVPRHASHGRNGRAHRRLAAEASQVHFVHGGIVLDVVEIDIYFQHFLHRRAGVGQLFFDFVENMFGVGRNVARKVRTLAGNEQQVAEGNRTREQRRFLGLRSRVINLLLTLLFCLSYPCGGDSGGRHEGRGALQQRAPVFFHREKSPHLG